MTINRGYVSNHKFYDEMGRITPNVDWSESHRPHFEAQVAGWLPVVRYETEINSWFVVSSGKVVSVDRAGDLCLSGYRKLWANNAGNAAVVVLTYTADDVAAGTIDLTTGVAVTAAVTYVETVLTLALRERGLIAEDEQAMDYISDPIGYASYNYYQAAGTDVRNPATYTNHNFKPQELAAITCDYVMVVPQTPAVATAETMANDNTGGAAGLLEDRFDGTTPWAAGWFNSTQIAAVTRYSSVTAGDDVVAYTFANRPVATNTGSTPLATNATNGLVNEKTSISGLIAAGDYFLDADAGVLFLYEAGGNALPSAFTVASTVTYYHYASIPASISTYFCAVGDIKKGDMLTYDTNSNLVKASLDLANVTGYDANGDTYFGAGDPDYDTSTDAVISRQLEQGVMNYQNGIIGQVLNEIVYPRDYLDRVRTAYEGGVSSPNPQTGMTAGAVMQSPGSATGGRSDQLTYTSSADKVLIVNWINR